MINLHGLRTLTVMGPEELDPSNPDVGLSAGGSKDHLREIQLTQLSRCSVRVAVCDKPARLAHSDDNEAQGTRRKQS